MYDIVGASLNEYTCRRHAEYMYKDMDGIYVHNYTVELMYVHA